MQGTALLERPTRASTTTSDTPPQAEQAVDKSIVEAAQKEPRETAAPKNSFSSQGDRD
ncbi:MAG: hypothetical protein ABSE77_16910 [Acidimicrobiales bacterium]|jgi:hypothetical protein